MYISRATKWGRKKEGEKGKEEEEKKKEGEKGRRKRKEKKRNVLKGPGGAGGFIPHARPAQARGGKVKTLFSRKQMCIIEPPPVGGFVFSKNVALRNRIKGHCNSS